MGYMTDVLRSLFYFLLSLLLTPLGAQQIRSLAVMDFEARGIATHEAASLTDWLRSEIVKIGTVPVVERGKILSVLMAEQDLQLLGCTSDACAVKIGQLLGVSHMVVGSIGRVGSSFSIIARTIDVETGRIVNSPTRTYQGQIEGLIQEMVPLAYEVVGQKAFYDREMEKRRLAELRRQQEAQQERVREQGRQREALQQAEASQAKRLERKNERKMDIRDKIYAGLFLAGLLATPQETVDNWDGSTRAVLGGLTILAFITLIIPLPPA